MRPRPISSPPPGFAQGGRTRRLLGPAIWTASRWTANLRMLPDFIIIGAQKAGTTSLCSHLFSHPQVLSARRKEVHFFDSPEYSHGLSWYRAHFPIRPALTSRDGERFVTGEASPYYLAHPHTPRRMHEAIPHAKLIVMLRNPVDRALSHYHHQVRHGREPLSFEDAIKAEPERIDGELERMLEDENYYSYNYWAYSYLERGRYAEQIERWLECFPIGQLLVLRSEDFFANPGAQFRRVTRFLGLRDFNLATYRKQNVGEYGGAPTQIRSELSAHFGAQNQCLRCLLKDEISWDGSSRAD